MNEKSTLFNWFMLVLKRDLVLSFKKIATFMIPLVFFLIVITLFPLALGTEGSLLSTLSSGVIWVAALLSSLLAQIITNPFKAAQKLISRYFNLDFYINHLLTNYSNF